MLETTMPRPRAAARSTLSVPVAATAISFSFGQAAITAAVIGRLLTTAMSASASRAATSADAVLPCEIHSWAKRGGRMRTPGPSVSASMLTILIPAPPDLASPAAVATHRPATRFSHAAGGLAIGDRRRRLPGERRSMILLDRLLRRLIAVGTLTLTDSRGRVRRYGNGGTPDVAVRILDRRLERRLALRPDLHLGEGFMDG